MKEQNKHRLLYSRLFLVAVFVLWINDFILKYQFHNYLTGKLSDFAGLFAFPFFIAIYFSRKVKLVYILTGLLFIFWKSHYSQFVIDFFNEIGIGMGRVVDYSDLIALTILPLSYKYWDYKLICSPKGSLVLKPLIIAISCFSFVATTLPKYSGKYDFKSELELEFGIPADSILSNMRDSYKRELDSSYISFTHLKPAITGIYTFRIESFKNPSVIKIDSLLGYTIYSRGFFTGGIKKKDIEYMEGLEKKNLEKMIVGSLSNISKLSIPDSLEITGRKFIIGDFDGDNRLDFASRVKNIFTDEIGVVIVNNRKREKTVVFGAGNSANGKTDLSWANVFEILPKEEIVSPTIVDSITGDIIGQDKSKEFKLIGNGIKLDVQESHGGGIIFWDGKEYKWYHIE
jgi:hypothetical protein